MYAYRTSFAAVAPIDVLQSKGSGTACRIPMPRQTLESVRSNGRGSDGDDAANIDARQDRCGQFPAALLRFDRASPARPTSSHSDGHDYRQPARVWNTLSNERRLRPESSHRCNSHYSNPSPSVVIIGSEGRGFCFLLRFFRFFFAPATGSLDRLPLVGL
eukprot:COSAG02_NODE_29657_length_565_cov_1.094421_1_plen_159_part_01